VELGLKRTSWQTSTSSRGLELCQVVPRKQNGIAAVRTIDAGAPKTRGRIFNAFGVAALSI
jgi:hypothetical protein